MLHILLSLFLFFTISFKAYAIDSSFEPEGWLQLKGDHFVVLYSLRDDGDAARTVLNRAEEYYRNIADDIGYSRYRNFWTWENRVKIILFHDQNSYVQQTGQPPWSEGFASIYSEMFKSRVIVSYIGQPNFMTVTLPHEIAHLILHDFIGFDRHIPKFFDEGVAQLQQKDDSLNHQEIVARLIMAGKMMPLRDLLNFDIWANRNNPAAVSIFYIESLYIVDFLVKTYGKESFKELCRHLRDGKDFEQALKNSYYPTLDSLETLQEKWFNNAKQYL